MFANLKATLLKVDLREGKKILTFETSVRLTGSELVAIEDMIKKEVILGLDSQMVKYSIRKNARTNKPMISYRVDDLGVVTEFKPAGEQAELDLGLPEEEIPVKEEIAEISREIVEEFVAAGLAPQFDDLEHDVPDIIQRHMDGESYHRIAADHEMSSGMLAEILDQYYARIAPLAVKWDEWRQSKKNPTPAPATDAKKEETPEANEDPADQEDGTDQETEKPADDQEDPAPEGERPEKEMEFESNPMASEEPDSASEKDILTEWEQEIMDGKDTEPKVEKEEPVDLDTFILNEKPKFDDIPYDFPELLARKKAGETWMDIATSLGIPSTQLSSSYSKYKKKVKEIMGDGAA